MTEWILFQSRFSLNKSLHIVGRKSCEEKTRKQDPRLKEEKLWKFLKKGVRLKHGTAPTRFFRRKKGSEKNKKHFFESSLATERKQYTEQPTQQKIIVIKCLLSVFAFWSWNSQKHRRFSGGRQTSEELKPSGASDAHTKNLVSSWKAEQKEGKWMYQHKLNLK